ncbi:MAG: quinone-dependent dihydroorotate dehydrogenase [Alphaproteobacteria bacterium]|nr:quinone-dependent dihydroorotate dehydrogenase [Alphaproteobacteria bacterium]
MADFLRPATRALRLLPAEAAHRLTIRLVRAMAPLLPAPPSDDPRLAVRVLGLNFPNPIGLAAGFDKDAEVPRAMAKFGFGFVECGTVTPRAQIGNAKPRIFRFESERAVINRMGFNNRGMEQAAARLAASSDGVITGINIGANKDAPDPVADYCRALARLAPLASYVTINVSSPNTPGLRALQDREALKHLMAALGEERRKLARPVPLLLKIAPDLSPGALRDIAAEILHSGMDGVIVSNTTIARPASLSGRGAREAGGLSGAPLFQASTEVLAAMRKLLPTQVVLVGAGGVSSGKEAYEKIRKGASLVQLYTALAYDGPGLVARIKRELLALLARDGFANVSEAIGADIHG